MSRKVDWMRVSSWARASRRLARKASRRIQNPRNPLLFGEGWEGDLGKKQDCSHRAQTRKVGAVASSDHPSHKLTVSGVRNPVRTSNLVNLAPSLSGRRIGITSPMQYIRLMGTIWLARSHSKVRPDACRTRT